MSFILWSFELLRGKHGVFFYFCFTHDLHSTWKPVRDKKLNVFAPLWALEAQSKQQPLSKLQPAHLKSHDGASLVAQWLRVRLPMQGTRVRALVWEDPTCRGATGPVSHSYWVCASGACAPQQERPRQWEARAPRWRVAPACRNWRKPSHRNEDPTQPKNELIN